MGYWFAGNPGGKIGKFGYLSICDRDYQVEMVVDVGGDCNFEREYTLTAQFPAPSPKKKPPCFSGLNTVNVQNKGEILLQDLRIGDYVQTKAGDYSRVFSFAHLDTQEPTTFLQIQTSSSNNTPLEITGEHILFANGGLVRADSVKVGDKLSSGTIERIGSVQRVGFYSPTTESGEFVASHTRQLLCSRVRRPSRSSTRIGTRFVRSLEICVQVEL